MAADTGINDSRLNGTESHIMMHDEHNIEFGENESVREQRSPTD